MQLRKYFGSLQHRNILRSMNELCLAINPALFPLKLGLERQIEIAFRKIDAIGYLQASIFCTIKLKE